MPLPAGLTRHNIETGPRARSIEEICVLTGLGRDAVYKAIRNGRLTARKLGRRTLITDDDLRQFLAGLPRAGDHKQASNAQ
jgi:excisionase family DNA binding protein